MASDADVNDQLSADGADQNNKMASSEEHSAKKLKLDEGDSSSKRRRNVVGKQKQDDKVMAEAKAVYGDLDLSEGRRLRKRSDPPKVEEQKTTTPRKGTRKKQPEKNVSGEKSPEEDSNPDKKQTPVDRGCATTKTPEATELHKDMVEASGEKDQNDCKNDKTEGCKEANDGGKTDESKSGSD